MPPPSSENDLKRRARRRLIGAVALTLLAVIVLPLLLEDEPPPASDLAVRMAVMPETVPDQVVPSEPAKAPDTADVPASPPPPPAPKSPPEPLKAASPKPAPKPQPSASGTTPAPQARSVPANETFVVQLAALSDATKADALKGRAALAGLPAYTDKLGDLTRVRVGPYSSREAAETAAKKLSDNGLPAGQVVAK